MLCPYHTPIADGAQSFNVMMPQFTFGRGCLSEVGEHARTHNMTRIALFCDAALCASPLLDCVEKSLQQAQLDYAIFSEFRIELDQLSVLQGSEFLRQGNFDGMISLGGGSTIDGAKAAMVYASHDGEFLDFFAPPIGAGKAIGKDRLPHIACPTTAGTGSECTSISVIRINELDTKFVIAAKAMLPDQALVDPQCIDSIPTHVMASSGFDALCHALECYTAKPFNQWQAIPNVAARPLIQGANPWSSIMAAEAMRLLGEFLIRGVADQHDKEARDALTWAASLAGMGFGNSGTHLPHALSYGITHLMSDITTPDYPAPSPFIPHGISVVVTAPSVFQYTALSTPERHLQAARLLGATTAQASSADAGQLLSERLIELMRATGMPNGLQGIGFNSTQVNDLSQSAIRQSRAIANAPRATNQQDVENIYRAALHYW